MVALVLAPSLTGLIRGGHSSLSLSSFGTLLAYFVLFIMFLHEAL